MTQEALKLALEALETYHGYMEPLLTVFGGPRVPAEQSTTWKVEQAITAIKEALREHAMREVQRLGQEIEQEPVAWMKPHEKCDKACMYLCTKGFTQFPECALLQRTFVGLTDEDQFNFCPRCGKRTKDIHTCTPPQENT